MSDCRREGSDTYLDVLGLDSPSLVVDKMDDLAPILAELQPTAKSATSKPARRGRKRNADKAAASKTAPGAGATHDDASGPSPAVEAKPKRGRGRPAGSTNRASNKPPSVTAPVTGIGASVDGLDQNDPANAARERSRVKTLRDAFLELQRSLPSVPPDTKLSKLDVLVLATTYISHLMRTLDDDQPALSSPGDEPPTCALGGSLDKHHRLKANGYLHPVKKWPMRSRLYAGATDCLLEGSS